MRQLTLTQPWATLVAIGAKRIETRSWSTSYRGTVAIVAGKGLAGLTSAGPQQAERELAHLCSTHPFWTVLSRHYGPGFRARQLPRGAVVCTVELDDVRATPGRQDVGEFIDDVGGAEHEAAFGNYDHGRFAWLLDDVRPLTSPLQAGGGRGLTGVDQTFARRIRALTRPLGAAHGR